MLVAIRGIEQSSIPHITAPGSTTKIRSARQTGEICIKREPIKR